MKKVKLGLIAVAITTVLAITTFDKVGVFPNNADKVGTWSSDTDKY